MSGATHTVPTIRSRLEVTVETLFASDRSSGATRSGIADRRAGWKTVPIDEKTIAAE